MNSSESHGYPRMVKTPQEIPISPTADLTFFLLLFLPHSSLSVLQLANGSVGGRRADLYAAGRSHEGSGCSPRTPALESDRGNPTRVPLSVWGLLRGRRKIFGAGHWQRHYANAYARNIQGGRLEQGRWVTTAEFHARHTAKSVEEDD